jgi:hypothetical protein
MNFAKSLGYKSVGKNAGKSNQRRAWIYTPTGQREYMSLDQMKYRHARGLLEEVYKEPPLTQYIELRGRNRNDPIDIMFRDMAEINLPAFNDATPTVQAQAIGYAREWLRRIKRFEGIFIKRSGSKTKNEAQMLAYAFCLNALTLDRAHQAVAIIYRKDEAWGRELVPEYRYINEDTVHLLNGMINALIHGGTEFEHDYEDSDKVLLYNLAEWVELKLVFKKAPEKGGRAGFFPFLSSYELYDLSRFGIHHEFNIENYQEMCFIQSFREYMEEVFPLEAAVLNPPGATVSRAEWDKIVEADCEFLRSIIKTFRIRLDSLKTLSDILNINIVRRAYNEEKKKLDTPVRYLRKNPRFQKTFELLYHSGHFMIWCPRICTKLKLIKRLDKFIPIPQDQEDQVKRIRLAPRSVQAKFYSQYCCAPMETITMKKFSRAPGGIDSYFTMDDIKDKAGVARRLSKLLNINVLQYSSLAALGQALIHKHGGYKGVMGLRGTPAEFIRKCLCPIVLGAPHDKPIRITGDLAQYDRKSSYPSVYTLFPGIPMGEPIEIDRDGLSELNENYDRGDPDDQCHFYVCLDIKSFSCRHKDDPYPLLKTTGLRYMDRTQYELIMDHYDVDYDFISGYYFKGYNRSIGRLALWLYELRSQAGRAEGLCLKRLMNSMWGKAMSKGFPIRDKIIPSDRVDAFCLSQYPYVYKRSLRSDGQWLVRMVRPIMADLSCPQFSVNVSSFSRKIMQDIIYKAVDHEIPIYYSNTDCLCLREADRDRLSEVSGHRFLQEGGALGDFVREYSSRTFICISQRKFIHILSSGGSHACYGPRDKNIDPEEYFERLFRRSQLYSP